MFDVRKILSNNIKKLRKLNKMSQAKFAEAISLQVQAISQMENAKSYPAPETISKICDVFDITPCTLFSYGDYFAEEKFNSKEELLSSIKAVLNEFDEEKLKFVLYFLSVVSKREIKQFSMIIKKCKKMFVKKHVLATIFV